jgi:hypothetical protein
MVRYLDNILETSDYERELAKLKPKIDEINSFPVAERLQQELRSPIGLKYWSALWLWLKG